ncbi:MAG: aspartate-semialdehyde dehydrogenase [Breznakia sp.]
MNTYNVAILGASGAVGQEMLQVLDEYHFPIKNLFLFASAKSAGKEILFRNKIYCIQTATPDVFQNIDIVLSAVNNDIAKQLLPHAIKAGAVVIDNSSAFRLNEDVPLVIPEINKDDIKHHNGLIANPNCATILALMAIYPLHREAVLTSMIVSTYQAVSGVGLQGIHELKQQTKDFLNEEVMKPNVFDKQIAFNIIPQIGKFDATGYTSEEMKLVYESRKILHHPDLLVSCTCVRIPVFRSHAESITLTFEKEIDVEKAKQLLKNADGIELLDDTENQSYPMPITAMHQNLVQVGRIREDLSHNDKKSLTLWCCCDQVRKGAASNAVQIALAYITK